MYCDSKHVVKNWSINRFELVMFVLRQRPGGNISSADESEEDVSESEIIQVKTIPIIRKKESLMKT